MTAASYGMLSRTTTPGCPKSAPTNRQIRSARKCGSKNKTEPTCRREIMAERASRAIKVERKLSVILGGYQAHSKVPDSKLVAAFKKFEQVEIDTQAFNMLYASEQTAILVRIEKAQDELCKAETCEE
ncbi:hypothetical protein EV179_003550 [Coemansia sp. RSA 487]|nr:hypothetical protein LPJ74_002363 [Coemansia sp. RSA 1843]KAJ2089193.1 hypothetical protein IW138_003656 [Coemansia sp. RSA 986]KAJ2213751.1 hypothetical protein EV179_003550 [Coemansia sp. RSA 487]